MHIQGKAVWAVVLFFVIMSLIVDPVQKMGLGAPGLFMAILVAAGGSGAVYFLIRAIRAKLQHSGMTRAEMTQMLFAPGYIAYQEVAALPRPRQTSAYSYDTRDPDEINTDSWEEYDEDEEDEEIESEDDQAIIEPNGMYLSDTFQPNIDSLLSQRITLAGISGSGKSNAVAVLCEELAKWCVPIVLFDTEDEYAPLANRRYMPRGITLDATFLNESNAQNFGSTIIAEGLQVVVNLKSFVDDDYAARIMCEIIDGMNDWEEAQPPAERVSCMVLLDEANKWLPQNTSESCLSKESLSELQQAIFGTMVRRGRKRGLGIVLATQRIAELDKRALQSTWKFMFRQTEKNDLRLYESMGLDQDETILLANGECFVFGPPVSALQIHMRLRNSPHGSHTPGLESVIAHRKRVRHMSELTQILQPQETTVPIQEEQPFVDTTTPTVLATKKRISLEEAAQMWNDGANSVRKLLAAMQELNPDITYYQANETYRKLKARQLIHV